MKQAQNQKQKHDIADIFTIEMAQKLYKEHGVATIVTDGRYIQIEKEPIRCQTK